MDKVNWCKKQKNGFNLFTPDLELSSAYFLKANNSLDVLKTSNNVEWKLIAAYYVIYQSLYALLMKIGVKCEIHSCTILFVKTYLLKYFSQEDVVLIDDAFKARNDAQYYVNRVVLEQTVKSILSQTPSFLVKCKHIYFSETEITAIRSQLN